jgi:hypothetical protein
MLPIIPSVTQTHLAFIWSVGMPMAWVAGGETSSGFFRPFALTAAEEAEVVAAVTMEEAVVVDSRPTSLRCSSRSISRTRPWACPTASRQIPGEFGARLFPTAIVLTCGARQGSERCGTPRLGSGLAQRQAGPP